MDHHGPWLNNCVGVVNHIYFMIFLTAITLHVLTIIIIESMILWTYIQYRYLDNNLDIKDYPMNAELDLKFRVISNESILNPYIVFPIHGIVLLLNLMLLYGVGFLLWLRQMSTFFTNKTTTERFGRKRPTRVDSTMYDNQSSTTSLMAEKVVEKIGKRREATGLFRWCKNFKLFCGATMEADCCIKDNKIGYQEDIIQELYDIVKERHGYEEDWGLVLDQEITNDSSDATKFST